jgi:hypothetical protein
MRARSWVVVLTLGLSLSTLTACGQRDDKSEPSSAKSTESPAAVDAEEPKPSKPKKGSSQDAEPSREDAPAEVRLRQRPETRAIHEWAIAYSEIVNEGDESASAAKRLMTKDGLERMQFYVQEDWDRYFPGPLPITVTKIRKPQNGITWVQACAWMRGWSQASETDQQREEREITAVEIGLVKTDGDWLVDGMSNGTDGTCANVTVEGQAG